MGIFIQGGSFIRLFQSNDDFAIINMGYDDFTFVKPAHSFYEQNFYTWHFIISGRGHLEIGGRIYDLSGGDSFFIPPDTQMRYFPDAGDPWEYVWFAMRGNAASRYGEQLGFSVDAAIHHCRNFERKKNMLKRTIDGLKDGSLGYFGVLSTFYALMDLSISTHHTQTEIQAIREIIDENYTITDFSIERLCQDTGFSHSQLLRLFKKEFGKTLWRYVVDKRLVLACEFLENSDLSIRSVALSCGFSDDIHFMKTFKERFGMTATEYRNRVKS